MVWLAGSVTILVSYLIGSLPFGLIVAHLVGKIDIREFGSGNIGATNVGRALGGRYFVLVLLLDAAKGAGSVLAARWLAGELGEETGPVADFLRNDGLAALAGISAMAGHIWPVFLGFRGGKGVATGAGMVIALLPWSALFATVAFVVVVLATGYVGLGSVTGAVALCLARITATWPLPLSPENGPLTVICLLGCLFILTRHRSNLSKMIEGKEHRVTWQGMMKRSASRVDSPIELNQERSPQ